ncbi:MAG TPA: hypothetical protein VL294_12565 [Pseudolysinimonas sp.]|nr:hypothetical protein [Pseudolysinimonas sp.]
MRSLTPVEFVEARIAYQGLLLEGAETGCRVVFQPSVPARIVPAFPTGDQLRDVRDRIMQQQDPESR